MSEVAATVPPKSAWFGHPKGLTILFLTQMWEQFSYYGMRALLVYYMTRQLLIGQEHASLIYGTYTATAYFTPILGGIVADRWLGKRRAVIVGASIMALGHFMMAFEPLFYAALATIALGNGLFLPSLPSQINDLYAADDPRRIRAYNIYYVGINLGGFLAPLICGTLGELYGWHWGFAAAGVGMAAGLCIYVFGAGYLPNAGRTRDVDRKQDVDSRNPSKVSAHPRATLALLFGIVLAVTVFRGAYEQVGNTVALWADVGITRKVGSLLIPMTWFQALNPLLVFLMTPPLLTYWRKRAALGEEPLATRQMALGAFIVAVSYALLSGVSAAQTHTSWLWLALFFVVFTFGELHILPTGLSLFARLAPKRFAATTMAAWFFAIFTGSITAGATGTLWSAMSHSQFFALLAVIATLAGVSLLALSRLDRRVNSQVTPSPKASVPDLTKLPERLAH
jgi:POT family proton-dependent oligopeptide transporter